MLTQPKLENKNGTWVLTRSDGRSVSYSGGRAESQANSDLQSEINTYRIESSTDSYANKAWELLKSKGGNYSQKDINNAIGSIPTGNKKTYTADDFKNATLDTLMANKGLWDGYWKLLHRDGAKMLSNIQAGNWSFNEMKSEIQTALQLSPNGNSELERNIDRYINWNNPKNPTDQANAFKEREKALVALKSLEKRYTNVGIDTKTIPFLIQAYSQLGETPGGGQTSDQTAQQIDASRQGQIITEANGVQYKMMKKPDGTMKKVPFTNPNTTNNTTGATTDSTGGTGPTSGPGSGDWIGNGVPQDVAGMTSITGSGQALELVKKALSTNSTNNLQQYDWWNSSPVKGEAWTIMQDVLASPQKMAEFVQSAGLTNLQQYDWWNGSPYKQDAWNVISGTASQSQQYDMGDDPNTDTNPAGDSNTTTGTPNGTNTEAVGTTAVVDPLQQAYDVIDSNTMLTSDQKMLFKDVVSGWDTSKEINMDNIITQFERIKSETIDPYFQTLSKQMIGEITSARDFNIKEREMQMEQERTQAGESIRQVKGGLEKAGMTFTGKGIEELGKDSAFAQTGQSSIPTQTPTEGMFYEGNVNQAARLISTSSQSRYLENMKALAGQAEKQIGSGEASKLMIPGTQLTGGVKGTLGEQQQGAYADTLSSLAGQEKQNVAYRNPIDLHL